MCGISASPQTHQQGPRRRLPQGSTKSLILEQGAGGGGWRTGKGWKASQGMWSWSEVDIKGSEGRCVSASPPSTEQRASAWSRACVLRHFRRLWPFVTPRTVACYASPFMGLPRQECCIRGISLDQGSNPRLLHWQAGSLPASTTREACLSHWHFM